MPSAPQQSKLVNWPSAYIDIPLPDGEAIGLDRGYRLADVRATADRPVNTVERAKAVYAELEKLRKKSATPKLLLVHSRFRSHERQQLNKQLQDKREAAADRIVVATQVVEAGVDISSRTLITA